MQSVSRKKVRVRVALLSFWLRSEPSVSMILLRKTMQQKWELVLILVPQVHVGLIVSSNTLFKLVISETSKLKSTKIVLLSEISTFYAWNIYQLFSY